MLSTRKRECSAPEKIDGESRKLTVSSKTVSAKRRTGGLLNRESTCSCEIDDIEKIFCAGISQLSRFSSGHTSRLGKKAAIFEEQIVESQQKVDIQRQITQNALCPQKLTIGSGKSQLWSKNHRLCRQKVNVFSSPTPPATASIDRKNGRPDKGTLRTTDAVRGRQRRYCVGQIRAHVERKRCGLPLD